MRMLRRGLLLLVALLAGAWALVFVLSNEAVASLDLVLIQLEEQRVSMWLIAAFVAGGVCGMIASTGALFAAWRRQSVLAAEVRRLNASAPAVAPAQETSST